MNKCIRLMKRIVALSLVLLLSIESFGAVVSDNDGSAFITKAEFDSIKNNFQSQIDQYNTSIDSKIDGAIASYLSGVRMDTEEIIQNAKSLISYPLTIRMNSLNVFNADDYVNGNENNLWEPNMSGYFYNHWLWATTHHYFEYSKDCVDDKKIFGILNYKNGEYILESAAYVTNAGIVQTGLSYDLDDTGATPHNSNSYTRAAKSCLLFYEPSSWPTAETNWGGSHDVNYISDLSKVIKIGKGEKNNELNFGIATNWARTALLDVVENSTYTVGKIKQIDGDANLWIYPRAGTLFDHTVTMLEYDNYLLDIVFNGRVSSSDWFPVIINGVLYVSNKNNCRHKLKNGYNSGLRRVFNGRNYESSSDDISVVWSPGLTLEPVGLGNTSRNKEEQSLWLIEDLNYIVTLPISGEKKKQKMTEGILITELPKHELDYAFIEIDAQFNDAVIQPQIIIDDNPIIVNYSVNINNYYDISDKKGGARSKILDLKNGTNKIYVHDVISGSNLYFKIVFDENSTSNVIIGEPKVGVSR